MGGLWRRTSCTAVVALQAEARAVLRQEDPAHLASATCAWRRPGCDLPQIASTTRAVAAKPPSTPPADLPAEAAAVVNTAASMASASVVVFSSLSCPQSAPT
ncbi:unnamed protein product [Urochloa humidicola]